MTNGTSFETRLWHFITIHFITYPVPGTGITYSETLRDYHPKVITTDYQPLLQNLTQDISETSLVDDNLSTHWNSLGSSVRPGLFIISPKESRSRLQTTERLKGSGEREMETGGPLLSTTYCTFLVDHQDLFSRYSLVICPWYRIS